MSMISEQVKGLRKLANQWKHNDEAAFNLIFEACDTIEALSAKVRDQNFSADRPTGEWVHKYDKHINCYWYECNQCGEYRPRNVFGKEWSSPYCPNCGARMEGGEEE